jgi:hypothetical protein
MMGEDDQQMFEIRADATKRKRRNREEETERII